MCKILENCSAVHSGAVEPLREVLAARVSLVGNLESEFCRVFETRPIFFRGKRGKLLLNKAWRPTLIPLSGVPKPFVYALVS
jgi:hypothetical protein